ncbi:hypothetical protein ACLOJK_002307 [Asimina triloba]
MQKAKGVFRYSGVTCGRYTYLLGVAHHADIDVADRHVEASQTEIDCGARRSGIGAMNLDSRCGHDALIETCHVAALLQHGGLGGPQVIKTTTLLVELAKDYNAAGGIGQGFGLVVFPHKLLARNSSSLAWFAGSTENSHLLKQSIVRFRRRARKGRRPSSNEVYPNRISTSQIRLGLFSGAGHWGPGCASDRHIGEWLPGFLGLVSCTSHTVEARPPSVLLSRHALVPGVFLWSSSVRRSRVRPE